jgi:hypothetical protein
MSWDRKVNELIPILHITIKLKLVYKAQTYVNVCPFCVAAHSLLPYISQAYNS